jgi:hypothetical protein
MQCDMNYDIHRIRGDIEGENLKILLSIIQKNIKFFKM